MQFILDKCLGFFFNVLVLFTFLWQGGLSGIGLGLGPGGQPIDANQLNRGSGGMGNMGPGGNHIYASNVLPLKFPQ